MNEFIRRAGIAALFFFSLAIPAHAASGTGRAECLSLASRILGHRVAYCIILPPSYDSETARRYPILYFLHGIGENEQMLASSGGLNLVLDLWEQHQIGEYLIVTPAADSSFYINSRDGRVRYEDFFLQELVPYIERRYRTRRGRASRAIGGISMGGYGALHLAFRHPELFGSVSAHSAATESNTPAQGCPNTSQPAAIAKPCPSGKMELYDGSCNTKTVSKNRRMGWAGFANRNCRSVSASSQ